MLIRFLLTLSALLVFSCDSGTTPAEESTSSSSLENPTSSSSRLASSASVMSSSANALSSATELSSATTSSSSSAQGLSSSTTTLSSSGGSSSSSAAGPYGTITYGNQTYKTIVIGAQTWMAENLNYAPPTGNSWCYNDLAENCAIYGRLYDWSTAMGVATSYNNYNFTDTVKHRGICPSGWHIPGNSEWKVLVDNAGGASIGARSLRATNVWRTVDSIVNTDDLYFSALPAGAYVSGYFYYIDNQAYWWTATGDGAANAFYRGMVYEKSKIYSTSMLKNTGYSVRCLKD
jgi:uncharacterized protein (TIGR02145 family)